MYLKYFFGNNGKKKKRKKNASLQVKWRAVSRFCKQKYYPKVWRFLCSKPAGLDLDAKAETELFLHSLFLFFGKILISNWIGIGFCVGIKFNNVFLGVGGRGL